MQERNVGAVVCASETVYPAVEELVRRGVALDFACEIVAGRLDWPVEDVQATHFIDLLTAHDDGFMLRLREVWESGAVA